MDTIEPRDRGEQIAVFRAGIIGALAHTELRRGELKRRLRALSRQKFRPPGSDRTRTYGVSTLQRWYYAYKNGGLEALKPKQRCDKGHGRELPGELKELLLDIRREHRSVPATVIRDTLIAEGRLDPESASISTVQRLYREHGLPRLRRGRVHETAMGVVQDWGPTSLQHPNAGPAATSPLPRDGGGTPHVPFIHRPAPARATRPTLPYVCPPVHGPAPARATRRSTWTVELHPVGR